MKNFISIRNLQYRLPNFNLYVDELNIGKGDYCVVVGKTGSGKTVLLECLAGLKEIHDGAIIIEGTDMTHIAPEKRGIGFAYQDSLLFPFLTVQENIWFSIKKKDRKRNDLFTTRYQYLVDQMGINHLLDRYPRHLSGGEKQRVSLARALLSKPDVLLLDEPLSALDINTRKELSHLLRTLHREDEITIIHVTHDMAEALQLGTKMILLKEGHILESDVPDKLFLYPQKYDTAKFLGVENWISATINREHEHWKITLKDGQIIYKEWLPFMSKDIKIGIRGIHFQFLQPSEPNIYVDFYINYIYFNGQMVIVEGLIQEQRGTIQIPIEQWSRYTYKIGDVVTCYVKQTNLLCYPIK